MATHRLKKKDIDRIFKEGKSFKEGLLILKTLKNQSAVNRFAFIISRKVSKKAVVRNKIKRRLKEIISADKDKLIKGWDYLFIILPGMEKKDFSELKEIANKLLKKNVS